LKSFIVYIIYFSETTDRHSSTAQSGLNLNVRNNLRTRTAVSTEAPSRTRTIVSTEAPVSTVRSENTGFQIFQVHVYVYLFMYVCIHL
jgi:beta-mannanase